MSQQLSILQYIDQEIDWLTERVEIQGIKGYSGSVAYDTVFAANLTHNGEVLFPRARSWIKSSQNRDGSWGAENGDLFDGLISTTTVLCEGADYLTRDQLDRGLAWVQEKLEILIAEPPEYTGIGFGLILPKNLQQIKDKYEVLWEIDQLLNTYQNKIAGIPFEKILAKANQFCYLLEVVPEHHLQTNLDHLIESNGSIACSVAATSKYFQLHPDSSKEHEMIKYLRDVQNHDGGFPHLADIGIWHILWYLILLEKAGRKSDFGYKQLIEISAQWKSSGVGFSENFPEEDADDTAVALYLLTKYQIIDLEDSKWSVLEKYQTNQWMETYVNRFGKKSGRSLQASGKHDDRWTASVNLHALDAYLMNPGSYGEEIEKLLNLFDGIMTDIGLPKDRWHSSPAYNNCHGILTFGATMADYSRKCLSYFLESQLDTGLWETSEETIFALLSLLYHHLYIGSIDTTILETPIKWLLENIKKLGYTKRWTGKVLYTAESIIDTHLISILYLLRQFVKEEPFVVY